MAGRSIGEELRYERLRQGLNLDDIAQHTRISLRSLEAIEADAFDRLPGLVFTRNFVRLYAVDLNLDPDPLVARLPRVDIESARLPDPPVLQGSEKRDPRMTAALVSALWLVTASAAGTGAWYYYNHYGHHFVTSVSAAPPPKAAAASPKPVPENVAPPVNAETASVSDTADHADASSEGLDSSRPVQVILTAHDFVWVQISTDGRTAFSGTLHPNDTRTVAAAGQVKILTGNAGGLDISLNGKPLDPIGPKGQTRTVMLTAEGPQFGPQNPPASSPL